MNALPPDPASEPESVLDGSVKLEGFDAELAAALDEIGRRVRPREFDSPAILRRTARRRAGRMLAASAAAIAVVVGATAFATRPGSPAASADHKPTANAAAAAGTDPLVVPGYFRTSPDGGAANGFTQFGATTEALVNSMSPNPEMRSVQTDWTADGVELTAQVNWWGSSPQSAVSTYEAETPVGTVNGRTAYYDDAGKQLTFWTGSQGYATALIFSDATGELDQSATADDLLAVARSLVVGSAEAPMPIRVTGLDSATVVYAGMGWFEPSQSEPWYASLYLVVDGRQYQISAAPGPAVTPSPTGTFTTTGLLSAEKTVDGVGITVTTSSGKGGSASAPTVAQVLADVTSLGESPSGWTTNVMVK